MKGGAMKKEDYKEDYEETEEIYCPFSATDCGFLVCEREKCAVWIKDAIRDEMDGCALLWIGIAAKCWFEARKM